MRSPTVRVRRLSLSSCIHSYFETPCAGQTIGCQRRRTAVKHHGGRVYAWSRRPKHHVANAHAYSATKTTALTWTSTDPAHSTSLHSRTSTTPSPECGAGHLPWSPSPLLAIDGCPGALEQAQRQAQATVRALDVHHLQQSAFQSAARHLHHSLHHRYTSESLIHSPGRCCVLSHRPL